MSIASEINRIAGAVSDAWDEIGQKGGTVPNPAKVDGLAAAIAALLTGADVSGVTAQAADVAASKFFVTSAGVLTQGAATERNNTGETWYKNLTYTGQSYTIPAGMHYGNEIVRITQSSIANLIAENIKDGVRILGSSSNGLTGTFSGPTKVAHGTETFSENVTTSNYTSHRIDTGITTPKFVCFAPNAYSSTNISKDSSKHKMLQSWWIDSDWNDRDIGSSGAGSSAKAALLTTGGTVRVASSSTCWKPVSGTSYIEFSCTDSGYVWPSGTWHWIVLY